MTEKTDVQSPGTDIHKMGTHLSVTQPKAVARGWASRTPGSAEPGLPPMQVRLGGRFVLITLKAVLSVSISEDGGNRPTWAIKGASLTPHNTTHFGEKKEKGRVNFRAIL